MSLFLLDTDTLSLYERHHPVVVQRMQEHLSDKIAVTVISIEEQLTGWYALIRRSQSREQMANAYKNLAETVRALSGVPILSFSAAAIARYEHLRTLKLNVGSMDLRIAAIALEEGAVVVTRNTRDFGRIPNLTIEDWTI